MELLDLQERQKLFRYCLMVWNDWNTEDMIQQELRSYQRMGDYR